MSCQTYYYVVAFVLGRGNSLKKKEAAFLTNLITSFFLIQFFLITHLLKERRKNVNAVTHFLKVVQYSPAERLIGKYNHAIVRIYIRFDNS